MLGVLQGLASRDVALDFTKGLVVPPEPQLQG